MSDFYSEAARKLETEAKLGRQEERRVGKVEELAMGYGQNKLDDPIAMELPEKFNRSQRGRIAGRKREKPKGFRQHADGIGYDVYHPTKGWRRISRRRVPAFGIDLAKRVGQVPWWFGIKPLEAVARG